MLARFDAAGDHRWSRLVDRLNAGTPGIHGAVGRPALSAAGNAYAFGHFVDSIDLGCGLLTPSGGNAGTFVASFDGAGQCRWARQFSPFGSAIAVLPTEGVLVAGSIAGPIDLGMGTVGAADGSLLALELDSQGRTVGTELYGTGQVSIANLALTTGGEVLITGRLPGRATFCTRTLVSEGSDDVFVVKRRRW